MEGKKGKIFIIQPQKPLSLGRIEKNRETSLCDRCCSGSDCDSFSGYRFVHRTLDHSGQIVIADKGYDAQARVVQPLLDKGKRVVIPSRSTTKKPREYDRHLYKERHLVENFFARLKQYRAIATRYDKTARNFLGAIHLVASMVWLI